jgi:hypothetical protein
MYFTSLLKFVLKIKKGIYFQHIDEAVYHEFAVVFIDDCTSRNFSLPCGYHSLASVTENNYVSR